jgi:hypothetical protein
MGAAGPVKKILDERRDRFEQVHREARESFGRNSAICTSPSAPCFARSTRSSQFLDRRR